jgi:hypothetical protein
LPLAFSISGSFSAGSVAGAGKCSLGPAVYFINFSLLFFLSFTIGFFLCLFLRLRLSYSFCFSIFYSFRFAGLCKTLFFQ